MLRSTMIACCAMGVLTLVGACGGGGGGADPAPRATAPTAAVPAVAPTEASLPGGAASGALAGTSWEALALGGATITTAPNPTLSFNRSGRISASGGCNTYTGAVRVGRGGFDVDEALAGTSRACAADLEARDRQMLAALQSATRFAQSSERLTLFDGSGNAVALLVPAL